jgi:hypothetical protein
MAEKGLNWQTLEPAIKQYVQLLEPEIALDTRKMSSTDGFMSGIFSTEEKPTGREMPLQAFIQQRQAYLLNHPEIKKLAVTKGEK